MKSYYKILMFWAGQVLAWPGHQARLVVKQAEQAPESQLGGGGAGQGAGGRWQAHCLRQAGQGGQTVSVQVPARLGSGYSRNIQPRLLTWSSRAPACRSVKALTNR